MAKRQSAHERVLSGRLALITGANRGIGLAIARALARDGCDLILTGRDQRTLAQSRRELEKLKIQVLAQPCDVRSPDSVDLDILINNAGIGHPHLDVANLPYPTWMEVIDTNLNGLFLVTQAALAVMKRGSTIVNNLSIAAERVFPGSAAYTASKHGALGFTNTLREELRPKGIRVIALLPGATDTAIWNTMWPKAPRRKMMSAEAVAQTVINALRLPENTTIEKIVVMPSTGTL
jgi:NAD(P)-dependent dehydrogenase (short-subunit alcohol dehydrogenase family)